MLLGNELDTKVQSLVCQIRLKGGVVNSSVVIAIARGVILYENRSLLQEYGGHITFSVDWVKSVLNCMGYVKRNGTKAVKKVVDNFPEIKATFLQGITD